MRRTSTCAWRLRPRCSLPCVFSRRLSCATTRCTLARSCSGPLGSARSSSFSGRAGGSVSVRSIWRRSSSWRSSCSKRRMPSRGRPSRRGSSCGSSGCGSPRRPSWRRMRCTSTPMTPEPSPCWPNAAIASRARSRRALSLPSAIICAIWRRSASRFSSSPASSMLPPWPASLHALLDRGQLDGAEEEAVEDEVEDAPVVRRLGERRGERLAERRRLGPLDLAAAR